MLPRAARRWGLALGLGLGGCAGESSVDDDADGESEDAGDDASDDDDDDDDATGGTAGDDDDDDDADDDATGGTAGDDDDDDDDLPPPQPDDCITEVSPGHHVFACDGLDFDVEIPPQCLTEACGLVVDVHGYTMSAAMQDQNTGMRALGTEHGYLVIQPNAEPDPPSSSWMPGTDDEKVYDFAMRTVQAFHLDPKRLHFTGFSQGGFMSWRFLCEYGDVFASVAPGAACGALIPGCAPDQVELAGQPDVLYMHGTSDVLVGFACAVPQRDSLLSAYGMDAGGPEVVSADDLHRWHRWTSAEGTVVEMIDHDYSSDAALLGGHCFPGSEDLEVDQEGQILPYGCVDETAFAWGEVVMAFFVAHPKG